MRLHLRVLAFVLLLLSSAIAQNQSDTAEEVADNYTRLLKKQFSLAGLSTLLDENIQSSDLWSKSKLNNKELVGGKNYAQEQLTKWFSNIQVERSSVKIIGIEQLSKHQYVTDVLVGLYGINQDSLRYERHAHWKLTWSQLAGSPKITKLEEIHVSDFTGKERALFEEKTGNLFHSALPAWSQLRVPASRWLTYMSSEVVFGLTFFQGSSIVDVNGDGLEDIYICQTEGLPNRLLIQLPSGELKDVSRESGLGILDLTRVATFADFDNDGDSDALLGLNTGVALFINSGDGTFIQKPFPAAQYLRSVHILSVADYDSDGKLDVYVGRYRVKNNNLGLVPDVDLMFDSKTGSFNLLFKNTSTNGEIRFTDVTQDSGLNQNNNLLSFSAMWHDFDDDGDLDIYVANDFGRNNLYQNTAGKFKDIVETNGTQDQNFSMNAVWGDWNRDGKSDLYVSNMFSSAGRRITGKKEFAHDRTQEDRKKIRQLSFGNSLFTQGKDKTFQNDSLASEAWLGRWAWNSRFADVDNNGWEDILVANGYLTNPNRDLDL